MKNNNILVISTKENKYIFDNISGNIIPYNSLDEFIINNYNKYSQKQLFDIISKKFNIEEKKINQHYNYIKNLIHIGYFYNNNNITDINFEMLLNKSPMSQLILILTEDCNLRCKYCIFSEHYPKIMEYSNKSMNFETAKAAIDEYIKLYNNKVKYGYRKKPIISFYGGEPFLNFNVMKRIIDYCNESKYDIRWYATTNGTILTDEIIKYITENDFVITFSIDGHKEQHDRNRVFSGGKSSFDIVYKNIMKLQEYKKSCKISQSISISCTYDNYSNFEKIVKFFVDNFDNFDPFYVIFNKVGTLDTNYYSYCDEMHEKGIYKDSKEMSIQTYKNLFEYFKNKTENDKEMKVLKSFFAGLYITSKRNKGLIGMWGGACFPSNKIAVAPDGNYYVCEKVNQQFKIGDIYSGLDVNRCNELFNKFLMIVNDKCKSCNVSRLCDRCYMHYITDENTLNFNTDHCDERKKILPKLIQNLCNLLENNPDIFKDDIDSENDKILELFQVTN